MELAYLECERENEEKQEAYRQFCEEMHYRGELTEGIDLERLSEICAAERDGRVVVLPCKVGAEVWLVLPDYTECSEHGEKYNEYSCSGCESKCDSRLTHTIKRQKNVSLLSLGGWIASNCFGKTVFLTRPEAEAALRNEDATNE
jgi:hypothetical protein